MSSPLRIESLIPRPLPGLGRVSVLLRVSGLPAYGPGPGSRPIYFTDMPSSEADSSTENPISPAPVPDSSPYPDVTLSILDQAGHELATTYIVEHKEPELDFTLHLRSFEPGTTCTARAEMTHHDQVVDVVQVPFELS